MRHVSFCDEKHTEKKKTIEELKGVLMCMKIGICRLFEDVRTIHFVQLC